MGHQPMVNEGTGDVLVYNGEIYNSPSLRLELEKEGVRTEMVSPLDDVRGAIKRAKPDVIVVTGDLTDALTLSLVHEQLWAGAPAIGLADVHDERIVATDFQDWLAAREQRS